MGRTLYDRNGRGRAIGDGPNSETHLRKLLPQGFDCGEVPIDDQNLPLGFDSAHTGMRLEA
jgi:hypothetical protein